jgi:hypothetical protein
VLPHERIVAVGLLTQTDLNLLGPAFTRAWPVENTPVFEQLVHAIDKADRELQQQAQSRKARKKP